MIFLDPSSQPMSLFSWMFPSQLVIFLTHYITHTLKTFIGFLIWLPKAFIILHLLLFSFLHTIISTRSLSPNPCFLHVEPLSFSQHALLFHATQSSQVLALSLVCISPLLSPHSTSPRTPVLPRELDLNVIPWKKYIFSRKKVWPSLIAPTPITGTPSLVTYLLL